MGVRTTHISVWHLQSLFMHYKLLQYFFENHDD
uniref:Uncharacterized protein n=1 Tax=Rhizophora mucronata TaxID=61149 RepID=A0A2P2PVY7_RHIMU